MFKYNNNYSCWYLQFAAAFAALHTHAGTTIKEYKIKALFIIQTQFPTTVLYMYYYIHYLYTLFMTVY